MKRLVFCFDGTWNRLDAQHPTNVVITAESVVPRARDGVAQVIYYDQGVGTQRGERLRGGAFGLGLERNLSNAYRFLIFNFEPDDEIYVFGFSRGAYMARSFVGLISNSGIPKRCFADRITEAVERYRSRLNDDFYKRDMLHFRKDTCPDFCVSKEETEWRTLQVPGFDVQKAKQLTVKYLGVWDTVGSLGIPGRWASLFNRRYLFHDTSLSAFVESARHAVAIDEKRKYFVPTLWDNLEKLNAGRGASSRDENRPYQQLWFPGVHTAVGGGAESRGLSDEALSWIWDGARQAGLDLDTAPTSPVYKLRLDYRAMLEYSSYPSFFYKLMQRLSPALRDGPNRLLDVALSAKRRWLSPPEQLAEKQPYRPHTLSLVENQLSKLNAADYVLTDADTETGDTYDLYVVQPGDILGRISKAYYGSAKHVDDIFAANRFQLQNPDLIYAGQVLRIPKWQPIQPHQANADPIARLLDEQISQQE